MARRVKKIPLRMCVVCRERMDKRDLIRVVRTPEREILVDMTGKKSGRGAYLCKNQSCLEKGIKSKSLERALEVNISPEVEEILREQFQNISSSRD